MEKNNFNIIKVRFKLQVEEEVGKSIFSVGKQLPRILPILVLYFGGLNIFLLGK